MNIFTDSQEFKHSQKLPLKSLKLFTLWTEYLTDSYTHLHFVVSNERIRQKEVFSQRASDENTSILAMTHLNASDWSLHP